MTSLSIAHRIAHTFLLGAKRQDLAREALEEETPGILEDLDRVSKGNVHVGTLVVERWQPSKPTERKSGTGTATTMTWVQHIKGAHLTSSLGVSCTLYRDDGDGDYDYFVSWGVRPGKFQTLAINTDIRKGLEVPPAVLRELHDVAEYTKQRIMGQPPPNLTVTIP